jgi:release factor glutamine methyltransferase
VQTDLLEDVDGTADLIVSNPPYIPDSDAEGLQPEVAMYEPAAALFAGQDGLAMLRRLFVSAPAHLADEGCLVVEFGFGQDTEVRSLAAGMGWQVTRVRNDLQGIPRVALLRR